MPFAANEQISRDPIVGGVEITEDQYAAALEGMLVGNVVSIDGGFNVGPEPEPEPEPTPEPEPPGLQDYDAALMGMYDRTAQSMGYMNWQTCALRAYRPGPFEAEGTAFYDWMEARNAQGYATLASVTAGERLQPTIEQFLSEMPAFVRPQ